MKKEIYILDASNFLFRSFFAIRGMSTKSGVPTNAVYGFIRSIERIIKDFSPDYMISVFDGPNNKASRKDIFEHYKANREGMPEELVSQMSEAMHFCDIYGIPMLQIPGIEADDAIGAIAKKFEAFGFSVFLLSSDKDLCQLVSDQVKILQAHKNNLLIDAKMVEEIHGVRPDQIIDYLAIMGDTSDNIPGIKGMGPKTAAKLLSKFDSLANLLANVDQIENEKQRQKVIDDRENALMSQKLATIHTHVEIPKEKEEYALKPKNNDELKKFYTAMEFNTLLKDLDKQEVKPEIKESSVSHYHLVNDKKELEKLFTMLFAAKEICIDTESTSLDKYEATLVGIGFAVENANTYYVPLNGSLEQESTLNLIRTLCANPNIGFYGHNIKYDMHVLANHDIHIANVCFDTMIASYLINPERNRHGLDTIVEELYAVVKTPFKELTKNGSIETLELKTVSNYCCEDVTFTLQLKDHFTPLIEQYELHKTFYDIEMPLLPVLFHMERNGIYLHKEILATMSTQLHSQIESLEKTIHAQAGEEFNIKSPKQLSVILFEKLNIPPFQKKKATGYSTSIDVLTSLSDAHPIINMIIEFRQLEKLRSTYVDTLPKQVSKKTKRIHCTFNQTGTATGRLASQEPNLQNIPVRTKLGRQIRVAFEPQKQGYSYLSADYSQIELRIVAHLSDDPKLIEAFTHSADVHTATAALIFGVSEQEVTKEMRHQAKTVNFGIIYGQQAFGLSKELGLDIRAAAQFIKTYFERYPGVEAFLIRAKKEAKEKQATFTVTNRRRPLPELKSKNSFIRAQAERYAVNTPIQGTQADLIKMAMIEIEKELLKEKLDAKMVLQVHDELIFEVADSELDKITSIVKEIMEGIYPLKVPLKVDISVGKNWGEC